MRISDWSSDVCSSDLNGVKTLKPYALAGCDAPAHWTHTSMPDAGWHALRDEALQPIDHAQPLAITAALCNMLANRSEERRVGKESARTCRSRVSPDH